MEYSDLIIELAKLLVPAAAALLATKMANARNDRHAGIVDARELKRKNQQLLVDLLNPAKDWLSLQQILVPALSKASEMDLTEMVETESFKNTARSLAETRDSLLKARFSFRDEELREMVAWLSDFLGRYGAEVFGPLFNPKRYPGQSDPVAHGLRQLEFFKSKLRELENHAVELLREE